ncbi:MAG: dihydropteroate synthase [Holosporaceae bacterium]|nr:dihydropteroate synthase [Holosporaceae bacterium]
MKTKETVLLAVGANLGNKLQNLRNALREIKSCFDLAGVSHAIETKAVLPKNSPAAWNLPYLNIMAVCKTSRAPIETLSAVKMIEEKLGRDANAPRWSPRIIDIDIALYGKQKINTDRLTIPHPELKNRDFWQFLLEEIGCAIPKEIKLDVNNYKALNHFVLYPQFVGIVNVTPDSFSDGGKFLDPEKAERRVRKLLDDGASIIDIGAQSTRPQYIEVSPSEEISRLSPVLERCGNVDNLSIDSYFDEVVKYVLKNPNVKWINDQNSTLNPETIKLIADRNVKLVVMLRGVNFSWIDERIKYLENLGVKKSNLIVDPGIGFGKSKHENIRLIKNLKSLRQRYGCEILLGASRKSFISAHSNATPKNRDLETIATSCFAADAGVDYLRVHNVKNHMRFFVTKRCLENADLLRPGEFHEINDLL